MSQKKQKIGVIAGTPVDTQMGIDFLTKRGYEAVGVPTASCPEEQNLMQFLNPSVLTEKVKNIIQNFQQSQVFKTLIYCNSLSAAVDLNYIRRTCLQSLVATPLDVYADLALRYKKIMLWAANGQCLAGIEKIFYEKNHSIEIIGVSMLPVVKVIEANLRPDIIAEMFSLNQLISSQGIAECLVLGCTHLPYLKEILQPKAAFPIIDPAEEMLHILER